MIAVGTEDFESESRVLGCMTVDDDAFRQGMSRLVAEDFVDPFHRQWFVILRNNAGLACAEVRLLESARELGIGRGGAAPVGRIIRDNAVLSNVPGVFRFYLKRVLECSQRRKLSVVARDLATLANNGSSDWIGSAETLLKNIRDRTTSTHGPATIGDTIADTIAAIDSERNSRMIQTGLIDVDQQIGGLGRGENIVIAAGTGGGKTALALSMAIHSAKQGRSVLYVTLEMERAEIEKRVLAHECEIDLRLLFGGQVTDKQRRHMVKTSNDIARWKLAFADQPQITIQRLRDICQEHYQTAGLDLLVVDYLQLIQPDNPKAQLREQISQLSRDLKLLSRQFGVPVILLSQLSREGAKQDEPQLWHLRESSALECDADLVLFVYAGGEPTSDQRKKGIQPVWLRCAKNRRGSLGKIPLLFNKPYQQFRCDSPSAADVF